MNTSALTAAGNNADFFKTLGAYQGGAERPKPVYVRLDGKNGTWNETSFNQTEGKGEKHPWKGGGSWDASILLVRWFAKDKYKEGSMMTRRTREFSDWNEKITLLSIDWKDKENGTKEVATFPDYAAFKDAMSVEYGSAVNLAIMEKRPVPQQKDYQMDLWCSLYVYDFETNRIVNVKLKGLSRKAVFDYLKDWRRVGEGLDSVSQVLTTFDVVEFNDPMHYYAAKLTGKRVLEEGEQAKVVEAVKQLLVWMKSFEQTDTVVEETIVPSTDEIKLSDIPF